MANELDTVLKWSEPREVNTKLGPRMLSKAEPNDAFWNMWRAGKEAVKAAGYGLSKDERTGQWTVTRWRALDAAVQQERAAARDASRAADSSVEIPAPDGLTYLPYQKAGIDFAAKRVATLIADEMGLGKTIQAVGVLNVAPFKRALVICPASLRLNWARELKRWLVTERTIAVIESGNDTWPGSAEVVVINYDLLGAFREQLRAATWDVLIVDECHYVKNGKALRTQEIVGRKAQDRTRTITEANGTKRKVKEAMPALPPIPAARRVFLTGTPIVNRPVELWPIISFLDPATWNHFFRFGKRYCGAKQVSIGRGKLAWDFTGATNLGELQNTLRQTIMVRRLKADVLKELPAKRRQIVTLPANGCARFVKAEEAATKLHEKELRELRIAVELAKASDNPADYNAAVDKLRKAGKVAFEAMTRLRHETALAKLPYVIEHLQSATGKVVVMAHHHDVVDGLKEAFGDRAVVIDGRVEPKDRQPLVDRFQNDPAIDFAICSIRAAGVGLTLTAATQMVFAELDLTPGAMSQAEDRIHRIGQLNAVSIMHFVLDGSLDARIARMLVAKQGTITKALDTQTTPEQALAEADLTAIDALIKEAAEAATREVTRKQLEEAALGVTEEQKAAVLAGLRYLDDRNQDRARMRNDAGFNALDTDIGASLAARDRLSGKQAALGARILRKYRRQLPGEIYGLIVELAEKAGKAKKEAA